MSQRGLECAIGQLVMDLAVRETLMTARSKFFATLRQKFASAHPALNQTNRLALACTLLPRTSMQHAIETPSIFAPVSTPAFAIRDLSFFVLAITAAIFVIVAGLAVYALIRFGRRSADPELEPAQVLICTRYSSVDDQALAGVIMWVPGSLPLLFPLIRLIIQLSSGRVVMEVHHA